jgi:hypothetical protein
VEFEEVIEDLLHAEDAVVIAEYLQYFVQNWF